LCGSEHVTTAYQAGRSRAIYFSARTRTAAVRDVRSSALTGAVGALQPQLYGLRGTQRAHLDRLNPSQADGEPPAGSRYSPKAVEGFLPALGRLSSDNPLRLLLNRIEEAQEPPPAVNDPYRAIYPERSGSERHVRLVDPADARPGWEWPRSWERERKLGKRASREKDDPVKAAYAERH
jgi:hypothetical protein